IAPWNFPWAIPVWKSAPALVAGNTVIFKPAELTPATAALLTEIYLEAGLPPGVFNMLVGSGSVVGEAIVNSPVLRAISFTGSNEVGGALYAKAAQRGAKVTRSEEHTSELQSRFDLVCRLLLEKKKK